MASIETDRQHVLLPNDTRASLGLIAKHKRLGTSGFLLRPWLLLKIVAVVLAPPLCLGCSREFCPTEASLHKVLALVVLIWLGFLHILLT